MEELFEFEGQEYTLAEVQKAAEAKSLNIDDYINQYNISRKPGKITPPKEDGQGVPAEVNAAPKTPVGVSVLEDTSLDLQNPKTRKELGFNYGEEQKYLRNKTIPERFKKKKFTEEQLQDTSFINEKYKLPSMGEIYSKDKDRLREIEELSSIEEAKIIKNIPEEDQQIKMINDLKNQYKSEVDQINKRNATYDKAIEQVSKDTGAIGDITTLFNFGAAASAEATQVINFENDIAGALIDIAKSENIPLEKIAQGRITLSEKEDLINKSKLQVLNTKITSEVKDYSTKYENQVKQLTYLNNQIDILSGGNRVMDPLDSPNRIEQFNKAVNAYNSTLANYKKEKELFNEKIEVLQAQYTVQHGDKIIRNFKKSETLDKFNSEVETSPTLNAGATLLNETWKIIKKATVAIPEFSLKLAANVADIITDENQYSILDSFADQLSVEASRGLGLPQSDKFKIVDEKGDYDFTYGNIVNNIAQMAPFSLYIMLEASRGDFKNSQKLLSSGYNKASKLSGKQLEQLNIVQSAWKATVNDNIKEGETLGLSPIASQAYGFNLALAEGLTSLIAPETAYLKTGIKDVKIGLFNNLKNKATKKAVSDATKQYFSKIPKEIFEEELMAISGDFLRISSGLGAQNNEFTNLVAQKQLVASTVLLSGTLGLPGLSRDYKRSKTLAYNEIIKQSNDVLKSLQADMNNIPKDEKGNPLPEYQEQYDGLRNARIFATDLVRASKVSPENVSSDQLELIVQKQKLIDEKAKLDSSFHIPINEQIAEIDKQIAESKVTIKKAETEQKIVEGTKKLAERLDVKILDDFESIEEINEYLKGKNINQKLSNEYGTIIQYTDGKQEIIINTNEAIKDGVITTPAHELFHAVLFETIKNNPSAQIKLGQALLSELLSIDASQVADSEYIKRLSNYLKDSNISNADSFEEALTLFSEATLNGDIKFQENLFTKIGDYLRQTFAKTGITAEFNTGRDVYNFIKDYNKSILNNKISEKVVATAKTGAIGELTIKDKENKKTDKPTTKLSKSISGNNIQKIFDEKGKDGAFDIIEAYKPLTTKLTNKYRDVPGFDFELLQSEIEIGKRGLLDLINAYDPSKGATLNTYIQGQLANRSIEAANRILDTEFKLDVTEAKGVTDTVTAEETIEAAEEAGIADEIKSLRKEIGLPKELISTVKNAVVKTFGTKLPNPQDPKFRLELQRRFRTELKKPIAKFVGKQADYESFLRDNFQSIYNKLPQSLINRRFKDFQEPVLDKNGKPVREKTAEGNKVYTKKKISKAEFIKYFLGSEVGRSTQGTRKTAIVEAVAEEIAFDATMEVLNDPAVIQKYQDIAGITGEVLPENFKSIIAKQVDRAENFKFSKSIANNAKAEYNLESQELGRILGETSLDKLSNKYSLISDAIIYEADPYNIKFSLTTKADGKWEQEPLNPLDQSSKLYKFKVGEIDYEIRTFKDTPTPDYSIFKQTEGIALREAIDNDPKSWAMTFADADTGSTDVTGVATGGLTNQFKVFGTVANAAIDLIKNEKLNSITFTAKEKSRKRLYKSLNEKFAKELGWDTYNYEIRTPDGEETAFIAYNTKAFPTEEQIKEQPPIKFSININNEFNVTAKELLYNEKAWAGYSNSLLNRSQTYQDNIGSIETSLGSVRPSNVIDYPNIPGYLKLNKKEKIKFQKKIKQLQQKIIAQKTKNTSNMLKDGPAYKSPPYAFGKTANEFINRLKNGEIFKHTKQYQRIYKDMWGKYFDMLAADSTIYDFLELTLNNSNTDTSHWHRQGALFIGFDQGALPVPLLDKTGKQIFRFTKEGKKYPLTRVVEYEHAVQNHIQWGRVLKAAKKFAKKNDKKAFIEYLENSMKDYVLIGIAYTDARKVDKAGFAHIMPKGWKRWWDRYFNNKVSAIDGGINPNNISFIEYTDTKANIKETIGREFNINDTKGNLKLSKSLNKEFNTILEQSSGIKATKKFSPVEARIAGKGKGKLKLFIPYSADDFVGLLYTTLSGGKTGDQQMEWYKENLLRPFSRGIQQYEAAKQNALREWQILKKEAKKSVPGGLNKKNASGLTNQEAVRLYIWKQQGMEIPGTKGSAAFVNENLKTVRKNPELKSFAERLMALNPEGYPAPSENWDSGDITTDLVSYIDGVKRGEFLTEFKDNAAKIFSDSNKEKLRALYGDNFIEALDDMLHRMKTGTNRKFGASKIERQFMDWTNNSVGAIMFFNARSAVLQTLSAVNFINFTDNNPINAALALANFPQYVNDFTTLFNSDFLKQRRTGLQTDVNADEIARAAKGAKNTARAMLSAILKFGFTPTQIADSFAIASGGATFYRNRINKYKKEGLSQQEAETKAFTDFQEIAEETQQSARPDRISLQQASSLGRLILAFGNTPMQYARLTKKATLDLINGRGDWKTNMSKIMYYSVIQNIIFSALQQGLFALLFDDEDDDKEKSRLFRIGNSSLDTFLRGSGVYGAAAATAKNMILKVIEESEKSRPDYTKVAIESTAISPPINSKLRKLVSAGKTFTYKQSKEKVFTEGFSLENPAFLAGGQVLSALTNLPADRVVLKADHLKTAIEPETELWQSIALSLGWSEWDLNMIEKQTKKQSIKKPVKIQAGLKKNKIKVGIK